MLKKTLLSLAITASTAGLTACNISSISDNNEVENTPVLSGQEGFEVSTVTPQFQPTNNAGPVVPLNIDILFADAPTTDGTANTADTTPPVTTALNKLAGFSTTAAIYMNFTGALDPDSVVAGQTVHLVKLKNAKDDPSIDALDISSIAATGGFAAADQPVGGVDYEANYITLDNGATHTIQILPKTPLEPKTKYVVAFTNGITSASGEPASASGDTLLIRSEQAIPEALQPIRTLVNLWDKAAKQANGVDDSNLILSYAFTTNGTTDVLHAMAAPGTFLTSQIPSIAHAEGAISAKLIAGYLAQAAVDAENPTPTESATAQGYADGKLLEIAQGVATAINTKFGTTVVAVDSETRTVLKASTDFSPSYYQGLIGVIADGSGAGLDTIIDKPKSRTYTPIVSAPNTAVAVPYDTLLTAQVTAKVEAQVADIATAEGAISLSLQGQGADQATIDGTLLQIAQGVATAINDAAGSTVIAIDANTRTTLIASEQFSPNYLTGLQTTIVSGQVADLSSGGAIYQGGLTLPNFLPDSEAGTADAELGSWEASDAAAVALGRAGAPEDVNEDKNITYRFPFADKIGEMTIPVMVTMPDASCDPDGAGPASGKPLDGWPVAIFQHGITVDRTAGVLVGNTLASQCIAMVAIDHAMHGIAPLNSGGANALRLFNVEQVAAAEAATKSPFAYARDEWIKAVGAANAPELAALAERHNNVAKAADQSNIDMVFQGALDGTTTVTKASVGTSGQLYINLQNFSRTRDAIRQTVVDLLNVGASIGDMDVDANGTADDLDADNMYFIGHSLGGIVGATYLAVNNNPNVRAYNANLPTIKAAALGNPGGGFTKLLENSPAIGAQIIAGLGASGIPQGSEGFEKFMAVFQAMVDTADPINFAGDTQDIPVLVYTDVGGLASEAGEDDDGALSDQVVPNNALTPAVASAKSYLAGTDALVREMGITDMVGKVSAETGTQLGDKYYFPGVTSDNIVRANIQVAKGTHSTFSSGDPQDVFAETYGQIISFFDPYGATKLIPQAGIPGDQKGFIIENTDVLKAAE